MRSCSKSNIRAPRWRGALTGILLLVAGVLAGCATSPTANSGTQDSYAVGQVAPINTLNPFPWSNSNRAWLRALYDPLVSVDSAPGGQAAPAAGRLATSWEVSPDGRVYTFHLRPGLKFSNGRPFDAQAVADMIHWSAKPENKVSSVELFAATKAEVVDSLTIRMSNPQPTPQLLSTLALTPILDATDPKIVSAPSGIGAYQVGNLAPNYQLTLTRNDDYWDKQSAGRYREVRVRVYQDASAANAALSSGQIDALAFPSFAQLPPLKKQGATVTAEAPAGNFVIQVNVKSGAVANPDVRRALSASLNRAAFVQVAGGGVSQPDCSVYPPGSSVYTQEAGNGCSFDPDAAKALLARAGYPSGLTLTLTMSSSFYPELATFAPIWKDDLAKIGVTLQLSDVSATDLATHEQNHDYQLVTDFYAWGNVDPAQLFSSGHFRPASNISLFSPPEYARMVTDAQGTLDPAQRTRKYQELNQYMMDQAFIIPIATRPFVYVSRQGSPAPKIDPNGMVAWTTMGPGRQ